MGAAYREGDYIGPVAPTARTFGGLLREMSSRLPSRPAISFEGREETFRDLDQRVDQLARGLLSLGVRHGETVSVLAGNRPEWLLVAFAAARVGAVLAPVNTWYKDDEIAYLLRHSRVKVLFTVDRLLRNDYLASLRRIVPELDAHRDRRLRNPALPALEHVIQLGPATLPGTGGLAEVLQAGAAVPNGSLADAEARVRPEDPVFILYTSGSTSRPKGVRLHHGDAIENDFQIGERQKLTPEDRLWLATPLFYGLAAVNAMPAAWTHGTCIVLQETFDAGRSLETLERERATAYYGLGNMTRALMEHPDYPHRDLSALTKGVTGFSPADKRLTIQGLGVTRCCSVYGLTESYGNCALTDADDEFDVKLHTQGLPLPGWDFRIVDVDGEQELPVGGLGELRISGYLMSGYHGDEDATAEAFDERGYFRTGDLAVLDRDGRMRFHSRLKEVIKVGGINVSPQEIEELISGHPDVKQVHVVGLPDEVRGEVIAAFVEPAAPHLAPEGISAYVADRAAKFKVPAFVLFRTDEQLPRVASGKVPKYQLARQALQELGRTDTGSKTC